MRSILVLFILSNFILTVYTCESEYSFNTPYGCYFMPQSFAEVPLKNDWYYTSAVCNHFPTVSDAVENSFLQTIARNMCVNDSFWLGGAVGYDGNWSWNDGTEFKYTNWAPGEPKNSAKGYCLYFNPSTGLWASDKCTATHTSVCKEFTLISSNPCHTYIYSNIMGKCLDDISGGGNRWDDWESTCAETGQFENITEHSVSIHNEFDNLVIQAYARFLDELFIGIHDPYQNGTFVWYDGSTVDYTNWAITPPTGSCAMMLRNDTRWYPKPCNADGDGSVVCEISRNSIKLGKNRKIKANNRSKNNKSKKNFILKQGRKFVF